MQSCAGLHQGQACIPPYFLKLSRNAIRQWSKTSGRWRWRMGLVYIPIVPHECMWDIVCYTYEHVNEHWKWFKSPQYTLSCIIYCTLCILLSLQLILFYIPYAYKFSWDFIFTNFTNQRAIMKIKTRKCVPIQYKFAAAGRHLRN